MMIPTFALPIRPHDEGQPGGQWPPSLFLKSYFARNVFLEIRLFVILQGIQSILTHSCRGPCMFNHVHYWLISSRQIT